MIIRTELPEKTPDTPAQKPPSNFREENYVDLAQGRLRTFRAILYSEIRRRMKQARKEAKK